ncbi:Hint domain-containing protein [Alexandriicola marinus]|uniref:Hint domain-containing protein n=1 Tax=Alexandriicola marinus TaxID=2081710 RepID=UPI001EEEEBBD|nr:Hint domain-containing protein [Alexandriicola marinus]
MPPLMRKIEVVHLASPSSKDIQDFTRIVPALPVFEDALCAFARGCLLHTDRGQIAVEDLLPGDKVCTADAGFQTLLWRGATIISPSATRQEPSMGKLTRIAADALGIARPMPDLILGPKARLIHRSHGVRRLTGSETAAIPARDFIDGNNIIELTPPTSVPVYHLGFEGHHRIPTNGVEIESYHPGPAHLIGLRGELLDVFLSCFPHVSRIEDFGAPSLPRVRLSDLDLFDVA